MSICINNQAYSLDELRLAVALHLYVHVSDETIGSIIAMRRTGFGSQPIACNNLTPALQNSSHTAQRQVYTTVCNDQTYWEARAREAYRRWWDGHSQIVQRYVGGNLAGRHQQSDTLCRLSAQGVIGEFLDTRRGRTRYSRW